MKRWAQVIVMAAGVCLSAALIAETNEQKVDAVFSEYAGNHTPGCALGVIRNGEFVYRKGYGMASLELGVPLTADSVFYMGSVSKQFTAASVVLAAEQGYLALDDDVRKYIPELPDYGHTITLREMLHHTSGLRDFLALLDYEGRNAGDVNSQAEILHLIARQRGLNNVPGEQFIYSNTNYFLLGVVIQRVTGKTLAQFAEENIFRPLGMTHTRFYDDHAVVVPGRVAAYSAGAGGAFAVDWSTGYDIVGAGGLMSSVNDLLAWDRNFYANQLGKGMLIKELETPGVFNDGSRSSYALGLELGTYRGLPTVEHSGALYGYRTEILRFPEQRFSVIGLCNVANANVTTLARKVADIYLQDRLATEKGDGSPEHGGRYPDASRFAGKYLDGRNYFVYTFSAAGDSLAAWGAKLRRVGPNTFRDLGTGTITFNEDQGGMRATLRMDGKDFFSGARAQPPTLSASELAAYAGSYQGPELDATYRVDVEDGALVLHLGWNPPIRLEAIAPDVFESDEIGTVVFLRGDKSAVVGMKFYTVSVRGVGFQKE